MDPTLDLSDASTEKSKLVDICDCITIIKRETDDGEIHQIWSKDEGGASGFVLSPGKYHVRSREYVHKVGWLNGSFSFEAKADHIYGMHYTYCTVAPAAWLFLDFGCPLGAYYAGFHRLKDEASGDIIGEASVGYD